MAETTRGFISRPDLSIPPPIIIPTDAMQSAWDEYLRIYNQYARIDEELTAALINNDKELIALHKQNIEVVQKRMNMASAKYATLYITAIAVPSSAEN